ncbi:MAG: hypothetical protein H7Y86_18290 [Rhizobacter sp.]|nr:hypothetical protein [Ferruginibacter sp.]
MKHCLQLIIILFFVNVAKAQHPRPDTMWGAGSGSPYQRAILVAPVVSGERSPVFILPNSEQLCFDKQVKIKTQSAGRVSEQCLYFNTASGYVGYCMPRNSAGGGLCDIKPFEKDFVFYVIGTKGNLYTYQTTDEGNGRLKHWVTMSGTQANPYTLPGSNTGMMRVNKKMEMKLYCDDKVKAWSYKNEAQPQLYYLFGKNYPPQLAFNIGKYLGNFGIGYQMTDKGLYIIMEMQHPSWEAKITDIDEVAVCFDPTAFQKQEEVFIEKRTEDMIKERQKIDRDRGKIRPDDPCAAHREALLVFRENQLRLQSGDMDSIRRTNNNVLQNQNVQKAYRNMMDPLFMIQGDIISTQLSICVTEQRIRRNPNDNPAQAKLGCLQGFIGRLRSTEAQMAALDEAYARDPTTALGKKSQLYLALMQHSCR